MSDAVISFDTQEASEHNPKSVFFGEAKEIITPLAEYLIERSVDLYEGKTLSDAFFGDYFFYVGESGRVKEFIEKEGARLPKTLLILTGVSDVEILKPLVEKLDKVKLIRFASGKVDKELARRIIDFFLGGKDKIWELDNGLPVEVKDSILEKSVDPFPIEIKKPDTIESKEEIVKEEVTPSPPVEQNIPAVEAVPNETETRIRNLYGLTPNPTGLVTSKPKRKNIVLSAVIILLSLLVMPILLLVLSTAVSAGGLFVGEKMIAQGDTSSVIKIAGFSGGGFNFAQKNLELLSPLFTLAHLRSIETTIERSLIVGQTTSEAAVYAAQAIHDGNELFKGIMGSSKGVAFGQTISSLKGNLTLADTKLALIEGELRAEPLSDVAVNQTLPFLPNFLKKLGERIKEARGVVGMGRTGIALLPEVVGLYGKRTFLVAFQNNMELRPTGGFIGSYALVSFEDGQLKDFSVEDVYTADGALKGHVDPPDPIKVYLAQEHWYLRDSNWDPDFAASGAYMAWFLDKELDQKVDGVIAVDLTMARMLLSAVGPVQLTDFENKEITADNLFVEAHTAIQDDFFPGSTRKKDLLGSLARTLYGKIMHLPNAEPKVVGALTTALKQKHLLTYFANGELEKVASEANWTGEVKLPECASCAQDSTYLVDANLGVNKANYYIERTLKDDITLSEDHMAHHELTAEYTNRAPENETNIGGDYKNYLRLLVPGQTKVKNVLVDRIALKENEGNVASEGGVIAQSYKSFTSIEALVTIPKGEHKTVVFSYDAPLAGVSNSLYEYTAFKQPGTEADPFTIHLTYPSGWQVAGINGAQANVAGASTLVKGSQITYNTSLSTDTNLQVDFRQ